MALFGVFLLTLISFTDASPPDCTDLVRPFQPEDTKVMQGKWIYVMGAGEPMPYHRALDHLKSSWLDVCPTSDPLIITLRWGDFFFNRCTFGEVNATISGLTTTFNKNLAEHKGHLLQTCSECLLWSGNFQHRDIPGRYIIQFTRTGTIDPIDEDVFKKQAECLKFPQDIHSNDGKTELCPDDQE